MRGARHTRISLTRMAVLVAATAPLGLVPAAAAAQATLSCPAMAQGDRQFVAELTTDATVTTPGSDRKSTRLNSSHTVISYAVFCLKKKKESANINAQAPTAEDA